MSQELRDQIVPSFQLVPDEIVPLPPNPTEIPGTGGAFVFFHASLKDELREDTTSVKIDHHLSNKDRWNARYNFNDSTTLQQLGINFGQTRNTPARSQLVRLDWTHTFSPTLLNEVGVALNRHFLDTRPGESQLDWNLCLVGRRNSRST